MSDTYDSSLQDQTHRIMSDGLLCECHSLKLDIKAIHKYVSKYQLQPSMVHLNACIQNRNISTIENIQFFLDAGCVPDDSTVISCLKYKNGGLIQKLHEDFKIVLTSDQVIQILSTYCCENAIQYSALIAYLLVQYPNLDYKTVFEGALIGQNAATISKMLDLSPDLITQENLYRICRILWHGGRYRVQPPDTTLIADVLIAKFVNNKIILDRQCYNNMIDGMSGYEYDDDDFTFNALVTIFLKFGYIVTLDDVEYALEAGSGIDELERFGIPYDVKLYDLCYKYNKYPTGYINGISKNDKQLKKRIQLHHKFLRSRVDIIEKHITKSKVQPDQYCFINCCNSGCDEVMKLLDKYNLGPKTMDEIVNIKDSRLRRRMYAKLLASQKNEQK